MKWITALRTDPFRVDQIGHAVAVFVDPLNGNVFIDEGNFPDAVSGVGLRRSRNPRFVLRGKSSRELWIEYAGDIEIPLGTLHHEVRNAEAWIAEVNEFLNPALVAA